jgi:hypothetical protein
MALKVFISFDLHVTASAPEEEPFAKRVEAYLRTILFPTQIAMQTALERKLEDGSLNGMRETVKEADRGIRSS